MSFRCRCDNTSEVVKGYEMTQYEKGKEQRGEEVTDL